MKLLHSLYSQADVLVVQSENLKETLNKLFSIEEGKIRVICHGSFDVTKSSEEAKTIKKRYGIPDGKKILLFFGNIRENKGLKFLLQAYRSLDESFFLVIAGSAEMASEPSSKIYHDAMARHDLHKRLLWINRYIPDDEIPSLFAVTDAVVLPYTRSFHAQSGVLNLAVAYEKPLVVSDVGGLGEVVGDYNLGIVIEPENTNAIHEGVVRLFSRRGNRSGCARYREEHAWSRIADKYIEIYKALL